MLTLDNEKIKIAWLRVPLIKGDSCMMDIHILIAEEGRKIRYVVDHQEIGLFTPERIISIMAKEDIDAEFKNEIIEQGLYVGVKRS